MTPQLQQAIRLLQLSSVELNLEVQGALDSNMMLELDEENTIELQTATPEPGETELNGSEDPETFAHDGIPEDLPVDTAWEDIYDATTYYSRSGDLTEYYGQEYRDNGDRNLQHHLLSQLELVTLSITDKAIAIALIDAINDDGYLTAKPGRDSRDLVCRPGRRTGRNRGGITSDSNV